MQLKEYIQKKVIKMLGLVRYEGAGTDDKLSFVNDKYGIVRSKLREYNVWYEGDDDELLNYYTKSNLIDYNYEPYYHRNKLNYFWSISSTEMDVKRTHSGHPRSMIDTIVNVIGEYTVRASGEKTNELLEKIVEENDLVDTFKQEQLPYTLVEGWGAYKINWDTDLSDTPIVLYYQAEDVDFVYKSNRLIGIIFKDYFVDKDNKRYLITETRYLGLDETSKKKSLFIEKELFTLQGDDKWINPVDFKEVPELAHIQNRIEVEGYTELLAEPCILYKDKSKDMYGKSVFAGKISIFDDLDQVWSQLANATRKSTPIEYIDSNYLERDKKTGLPQQPHAYDRKYVMFKGAMNSDGGNASKDPVHVTQPELRLEQFMSEASELLKNSVSGLLSPASMGIDVAKKDNADAQREKEKVTIFTRNAIVNKEIRILKSLLTQCMHAYELMHTGKVTVLEYDITVEFPKFADDSYDNKLAVLGKAFGDGIISPEMLVNRLYDNEELSDEDKQREIDYIKENNKEPFEEGFPEEGDEAVLNGTDEYYEDENSQNLF